METQQLEKKLKTLQEQEEIISQEIFQKRKEIYSNLKNRLTEIFYGLNLNFDFYNGLDTYKISISDIEKNVWYPLCEIKMHFNTLWDKSDELNIDLVNYKYVTGDDFNYFILTNNEIIKAVCIYKHNKEEIDTIFKKSIDVDTSKLNNVKKEIKITKQELKEIKDNKILSKIEVGEFHGETPKQKFVLTIQKISPTGKTINAKIKYYSVASDGYVYGVREEGKRFKTSEIHSLFLKYIPQKV